MKNEVLRKRITKLIAMSYAISEDEIWQAYKRLNDLEKLLNLLETNTLQRVIKEISEK